jgi:tetratricopeptide (TPR) repeat protein
MVLAAAAAMRLVYLLDYRAHTVFWDAMLLDAEVYDEWARRLATGMGEAAEVYTLAPLYPWSLASIYRIFGPSYPIVYVLQAALGLLNIALLHSIGRRVFGERVALIAAVMATLYGSFMFMESKLMSTTLALTLGLALMRLLLAAADRRSAFLWGACGLLLGVTALARPETLLFAPMAAWWIHRVTSGSRPAPGRARPGGAATAAPVPPWQGAGAVALFLAMIAVPLAPVAVRNARVSGEWSLSNLISSQAGITFYQSNNARARGLYYFLHREGFSGNPKTQAAEEKAIAEKESGRPLSRSQVSRYWMGRGLSWIASDPGGFLALEGRKLLRFLGTYEYSTEYIFHAERQWVLSLWLGFLPFAAITSLAMVGIMAAWKERWPPPALLLALFVIANLMVALLFYVSSRYRMPAAPYFILFAAQGLDRIVQGWRSAAAPERTAARARLAVAALLFVILHVQVDESHLVQEGNVHYNAGVLHYNKKQYEESAREYRRALDVDGKNWRAWYNLGNTWRALDRRDDAIAAYREALRHNPGMEPARAKLRELGAGP